jgi:hypothetical protein
MATFIEEKGKCAKDLLPQVLALETILLGKKV